jgi:gluconokinase
MTTDCLQFVVMGVTASGKTAVARRLAEEFGIPFAEGDDLHPQRNIDKMAAGIPLTDEDRLPWLETLADLLVRSQAAGTSTILTCSALRRGYRDVLRGKLPAQAVYFLHVHASFEVLHERMAHRTGHFMPAALLQSQFDTLEPLQPDEHGVVVDVTPSLDMVVEQAVAAIRTLADDTRDVPRLCPVARASDA